MADTIERTIYKLELDDSGYIRGVESMAASTKKFADQQEAANKRLLENEKSLKVSADVVEKNRKALESYTGSDKKYKEQLETTFKASQTGHEKLTELVDNVRKGYERAKKAAEDFANTSQRATGLQQGTTGGKIPTAPPPGIPSPITAPIIPPTAFADFGLAEILAESTVEFEKLRTAIGNAEVRMNALNAEDEEFKLLAPIVEKGKIALQQFDDAAKKAGGSTLSLRTQIRQGRDELVRMEETGRGTSKEYIALEKNVARLTDAFGDQQARIKILASDTRLLDFGKAAITSATSAFQVYASVSILAGDESAELQKKTMQLFAAMQLLTSLEQLSNQVKRGGVLITNLQSASLSVYTAVVGASTGALRAFRLALLGTGIGAAVVAIGALVLYFRRAAAAAAELKREETLLNDIQKEVAESAGAEIATLQRLYSVSTNTTISIKERKKAVDELQKQYPEHFKNINDEIILQGKAASAYDATKLAILESAKARAIESKLSQLATDELEKDQAKQEVLRKLEKNRLDQLKADRKSSTDTEARGLAQFTAISKGTELKNELGNINEDLEDIAKDREFLLSRITTAGVSPTTDTKTPTALKEIENEFARKKAELDARLAELTRKEADNESKIRIEFAARLAKEQLEIETLLKQKKVTKPQAEILKAENIQINTLELDKALADFRKKIADAREKLNDELTDLQNKALADSLNLIQEEFDRRAALIEFNEKRELDAAKEATQDRLESLELNRLLIGEQAYQDAKAVIITNGEQESLNIIARFGRARQDLAADIFQKSLDAFQLGLDAGLVARDQELAKQIRTESDKFLRGEITFEQFQKNLTRIQRQEEGIRRDATLANQRSELSALDRQIAAVTDKTSQHYKDLLKQKQDLEAKIAAGEIEDAVKDAEEPETDPRTQRVIEYAEAVGQLADSVIAFWQKANEAESAALDRSITLQEKRVEAAQRIAERGNAQYLKQEEDRLKELQIQKENAARRELAINAALQASQLLVGITGAIAKIATPGIGIAETIGAIAVIFAALATGYGLVKSLQGSQPKLAEGTTYVTRGKNKPGKDTIPAWLDEGEAVIPENKNKNYKKSVEAIYHGKVPADVMNEFVENYVSNKTVKEYSDSTTNNKYIYSTINENLSTYKEFVHNVSKVPAKVLNSFIENYEEKKYFRGTPDLKGKTGIDKIPVWATKGEAIIPVEKNKAYSQTIKAVFEGTIPAERLNNFVNNYHTVKPVPQPNYERIKEAAELKITSDGKMAVLLSEQNKMLAENNDLQRATIRALKGREVNVSLDKNGFAASYLEVVEQIKRDKRV